MPAIARPCPSTRIARAVVFTTLYPLADLVRQVGGESTRVDWLLDLGDPIDGFVFTRREAERFNGVDLIVCDSLDRSETWGREKLDRFRNTPRLIEVWETAGTNEVPPDGLLCLDPVLAGRTARLVADNLGRRFPRRSATFHARADDFVKQVDATSAAITIRKGATVVVLSNLFQPLLARVGIKQLLVSADPLNLRRADAQAIRQAAEYSGARSLIVPFDTPSGRMIFLQEQTGLHPIALDALGYPNYGQHSSYLDLLKFNLEQLQLATQ